MNYFERKIVFKKVKTKCAKKKIEVNIVIAQINPSNCLKSTFDSVTCGFGRFYYRILILKTIYSEV